MLYIGADHNGFAVKELLKKHLERIGIAHEDLTPRLVPNDDYPFIAQNLAKRVKQKAGSIGILLCGSGNGMLMAANRIRGIRAALTPTPAYAHKAKTDENANIIVLPAWWVSGAQALKIVKTWLSSHASPETRHARRIKQLDKIHG